MSNIAHKEGDAYVTVFINPTDRNSCPIIYGTLIKSEYVPLV